MPAVQIKPFVNVMPMVYCYSEPGVTYRDGWVKIGYTEKQTPQERIKQQTHTPGIRTKLEWADFAMFKDGSGEYFDDKDFHKFLEVEKRVEREPKTELFHIDGSRSQSYFNDFASRRSVYDDAEHFDYLLRQEQRDAVEQTCAYFKNGGTEFLWNAKPRFGKTLTAYDLVRRMGFTKVLIVTNRPSIANSWAEDFNKFIGWRGELAFVSDTDALKGKKGVLSREQYLAEMRSRSADEWKGMVAFESLQGLKGSVYFGGKYDKLEWMSNRDVYGKPKNGIEFDLLIVDEAQEGVDTMRTDRAFRYINRKHTLYLSGTPFKALADGQFNADQIFNWTYADEQDAKAKWAGEEYNPYEPLPRLAMFTYQLSNMIYDQIQRGADLSDDDTVDYAFDLNEFFATNESGAFLHEAEIKKFLHTLVTQEKYPFSTPELRGELTHTLWLLNRVASARALAKLLQADPVFSEYEVVLAAGDGRLDDDDENMKAFDRVKQAIATHEKTITLSVGQLTVGVTIPEWSGVLMLCNMQSPSSYMQAAFRAQNPCIFTKNGRRYRKETAYVFDFDPARTLIVFDEFANNLSPDTAAGRGTSEERRAKIKRLLNFFPVLGEDDEGRMVELDAAQVLSIPRRLKSVEVVRRGFMSNFLFQNISNVFGAPAVVQEIVGKLTPAHEEPKAKKNDSLSQMGEVPVDDEGNVDIPREIVIGKTQELFGPKIYEDLTDQLSSELPILQDSAASIEYGVKTFVDKVKESIKKSVVEPVMDNYDVKKSARNRIERQVSQEIERTFGDLQDDFIQQKNIAVAELNRRQQEAETQEEIAAADRDFQSAMQEAQATFQNALQEAVQDTIQNKPAAVVEQMERQKAEEEKKSVEDSVRDHLRGFSRTIPSFIMAYGDEGLTLANFDEYTEDDVFLAVTGITEDDFRFLRDGGDYEDPSTGETAHFEGHLFDETVFNDSIREFLRKKEELANYFEEGHTEDIFDYIPPQKTNQIFTPRWVVKKMVDELETENPGCFDDPTHTFADLYMKSGLYITEIVKRLFHSPAIKEAYPDDGERIRHILREQVYGLAPTRIIYLIATNYILGFDETLKSETKNFAQGDAAEAAKNGTLEALVDQCFKQR